MKLIPLLWLLTTAHASPLPGCWSDEIPNVADGRFLVTGDFGKLSAPQIETLIHAVNSGVLRISRDPMRFGAHVVFVVDSVATPGQGRAELKNAVREQLSVLAGVQGISIQCDAFERPLAVR